VKTNIQATVNHEARFAWYDLGWPGAVTNVKIFKNLHLCVIATSEMVNTFLLIKVSFIL